MGESICHMQCEGPGNEILIPTTRSSYYIAPVDELCRRGFPIATRSQDASVALTLQHSSSSIIDGPGAISLGDFVPSWAEYPDGYKPDSAVPLCFSGCLYSGRILLDP